MSDAHHLSHNLISHPETECVLYLHGLLGCGDDWGEVTHRLGNAFSHLTLDIPGHRMPSDRLDKRDYTMPGCAKLVVDLLDHLQIARTNLVAYSMGGRLGLYLLTHYPDRFERAVIESASPGLRTASERTERRKIECETMKQLREQPYDAFLQNWYDRPLFQTMDRSDPRFASMLMRRGAHDPNALALSLEHMGTSVQPSMWDNLGDLHLPVLFVTGAKDSKYCLLANEMVDLCPVGSNNIVQDAGHNTHWECPDEFCQVVRSHLTG